MDTTLTLGMSWGFFELSSFMICVCLAILWLLICYIYV